MKKRLFFTFILALYYQIGLAQNTRFSLGIEAGPSLICLKEPYQKYFENTGIGFSTGIFIQYNAKKIFSLKLAPSFERKGKWDVNHVNLNYFVVPLLFRAEIGSKTKGFLVVGPYCGYLMEAYLTADYYEGHRNMEYINRFDAGISAGLGINIPIEQIFSISIELRNNFGLYQIVKREESEEYNYEWKTYSTNLLISFSYSFSKRKGIEKENKGVY
jgi:hypothetical protein